MGADMSVCVAPNCELPERRENLYPTRTISPHTREPRTPVELRKLFRAAARGIMVAPRFNLDPARKRSYALDRTVSADAIQAIDLDLPRTASCERLARQHVGRIRAMLLRFLAEDPQLGYCQGLNLVAAVFAVASESQREAYYRFRAFVKSVRGLWLPGFPLLAVGAHQFNSAARERAWYKHLSACDVEVTMFLPQALMTMFTMWLPFQTVVEHVTLSEREGLDGLIAMTIAVLDHVSAQLQEQRNMEGVLKFMQQLQDVAPCPQVLEASFRNTLPAVKALQRFSPL